MAYNYIHKDYKDGLSGIMRIKNESAFLEACIDSCINGLDELIVVYVDCTDNTEEILARKRQQYPERLKVFKYDHKVYWFDLSKEEYEYAQKLPEDSPSLYSNVCNYSLSKVSYKYVVKIDADQLYFTEEIKKWSDVCAGRTKIKWRLSYVMGWIFMNYLSIYRRASSKLGRPLVAMLPETLVKWVSPYYEFFAQWQLLRGNAVIALSGLNLFKDGDWFVPFDNINIHPPYNGEGDTVIFPISAATFFKRHPNNRSAIRNSYSVTEDFCQPNRKMMFAGPVWFHQHANRSHCWPNVKKVKSSNPDLFVPIRKFLSFSYQEVHSTMDSKVNTLYQRVLFAYVHIIGRDVIKRNIPLLDEYKLCNEKEQ